MSYVFVRHIGARKGSEFSNAFEVVKTIKSGLAIGIAWRVLSNPGFIKRRTTTSRIHLRRSPELIISWGVERVLTDPLNGAKSFYMTILQPWYRGNVLEHLILICLKWDSQILGHGLFLTITVNGICRLGSTIGTSWSGNKERVSS